MTVYDKTTRRSVILDQHGEPIEVYTRRQRFIGFYELKERQDA